MGSTPSCHELTTHYRMDSGDSRSATLSPHPEKASPPSEPTSSSPLKRKITPSNKAKTMSTRSPYKRVSKAKSSKANDKADTVSGATVSMQHTIVPALTPPTTPARTLQALAPSPSLTSASVLLVDDVKNPASINRFKGITPVLVGVDRRPLKLRFPGVNDGELFVVTGLLQSHDMTIVKEVLKNPLLSQIQLLHVALSD